MKSHVFADISRSDSRQLDNFFLPYDDDNVCHLLNCKSVDKRMLQDTREIYSFYIDDKEAIYHKTSSAHSKTDTVYSVFYCTTFFQVALPFHWQTAMEFSEVDFDLKFEAGWGCLASQSQS